MPNDDAINPFRILDAGGTFDEFVEAVGEQMETFIFNYCGNEADWFRMRKALLILIDRENGGWDQAAEENTDE